MSLFNSSLPSLPSSSSQWVEALGFVPTAAAKAAATPKKVNFLKLVREANPSVGNAFVQNVLTEQISEICFELKGYTIKWLAQELGNQFLTLCIKEVRESTRTFAVYSLNQISEEVLSGISIRGKKKRFRDWRDIVFTTVWETPVVEYKTPASPVPAEYKLVTSNHELLRAADEFGNCAFALSQTIEFLQGTQGIITSSLQDPNPVMIHFSYEKCLFSLKEIKHKENVSPSSFLIDLHKRRLNEDYEKRKFKEEEKEKEKQRKEIKQTIKHTILFCCFSLTAVAFLSTASVGFLNIVYRNNIEQHK